MRTFKVVEEHAKQTDIRLQLLANGYRPLPTAAKVAFMKGWPDMIVDERKIAKWPLFGPNSQPATTTAIQLRGNMLAIDVDVTDEGVSEAVWDLMCKHFGKMMNEAGVRDSGSAKFMVMVRTERPYNMWKTAKFADKDGNENMVEVYGGASTRYFSCYGAHTLGGIKKGSYEVVKDYSWDEVGCDPLTTRPEDLPLVTKDKLDAFLLACSDLLEGVKHFDKMVNTHAGEYEASISYDLHDDMVFDTVDGPMDYFEAVYYAMDNREARCSASFLREDSGNTSKCRMSTVGEGEELELMIFDHETWTTHYPKSWAPKTTTERMETTRSIGEKFAALLPQEVAEAIEAAQDAGADTEAFEDKLDELLETLAFNYIDGTYHWLRRGIIWNGIKRATLMAHLRQFDLVWEGPRGGQRKMSIVDAWEKYDNRMMAAGVRFNAKDTDMIYQDGAEMYLNGFFGFPELGEGDTTASVVLDEFLEHLIPNEAEREWFIDWMAAKYQNPASRNAAVLFVAAGVQGAGRGTLFSIMDKAFGGYSTTVSENDLLNARFNDFLENNLLVFCNEVGGASWSERKKGYEVLKDRVDPAHTSVRVERKGIQAYRTETFTSFILASNNPGSLTMDAEDRRFAIISNGEALSTTLLGRMLAVGFGSLARQLQIMLAAQTVTHDVATAPHFDGREEMLTALETDVDEAIRKVIDDAPEWRAWTRSDFESKVKLEMTGSSKQSVPGLRNEVTGLVGKRGERMGATLLSKKMRVGSGSFSVVVKDVFHFTNLTSDERARVVKGVHFDGPSSNVEQLHGSKRRR